MRANTAFLVLSFYLACGATPAQPEEKCPVAIGRVELSYDHRGGESKPQLKVEFGNYAGKRISTVTFSLSVLDGGGYPHPYPNNLRYLDGLESGKKKAFTWDLASESVDIHRAGETVAVLEVEFVGTESWIDDGSQSCAFKVDFHAR